MPPALRGPAEVERRVAKRARPSAIGRGSLGERSAIMLDSSRRWSGCNAEIVPSWPGRWAGRSLTAANIARWPSGSGRWLRSRRGAAPELPESGDGDRGA
jgi:hypothetical protein